jgi:hypothetical protein
MSHIRWLSLQNLFDSLTEGFKIAANSRQLTPAALWTRLENRPVFSEEDKELKLVYQKIIALNLVLNRLK